MAQPGDAVVEQAPARAEAARQALGVDVDLLLPHVLDHADAGDRVEALAAQVAVVLHADLDAVGEAGVGHAPAGQLGLGLGQRDAGDLRAVASGGVDGEAAPAAADVEHALALADARASGRSARASRPAPPPAWSRRARRCRSCRSSTRRGRARRTRSTRRSGGAPPARRGSGVWRLPRGRSSAAGGRGGRVRPQARTAASASRACSRLSTGGGSHSASTRMTASRSSTSSAPEA